MTSRATQTSPPPSSGDSSPWPASDSDSDSTAGGTADTQSRFLDDISDAIMNPEYAEAIAMIARATVDAAVRDAEYRERVIWAAHRVIEARRKSSQTTDV
jgi:hypothetical protein